MVWRAALVKSRTLITLLPSKPAQLFKKSTGYLQLNLKLGSCQADTIISIKIKALQLDL